MTDATMAKRTYNRRTDEQRIQELKHKIAALQTRLEKRERPDQAVLKEIPKVQRRLRKFIQLSLDNGRQDIANSTLAFVAGLERHLADNGALRRSRTLEELEETEDRA
jgi:molecular chaperone GrpE (heat shock protein)